MDLEYWKIYQNDIESIQDLNGSNNNIRYIIIKGSRSGHCCFEYTIVDTKKGLNRNMDSWNNQVCETFGVKDAIKICSSLNKMI